MRLSPSARRNAASRTSTNPLTVSVASRDGFARDSPISPRRMTSTLTMHSVGESVRRSVLLKAHDPEIVMATSFEDFVNRQHEMANETERSIDWAKELEEWKDHLAQFNIQVLDFLHTYVDQNKVRVEFVTKRIHEQHIGRYEVRAIEVTIGNTKVIFDPIGTNLFGAKGRVDMKGPSGIVRFVLVPENSSAPNIRIRIQSGEVDPGHDDPGRATTKWTWKISTPPPDIKYIEVQEETFQTAVMEVVNG